MRMSAMDRHKNNKKRNVSPASKDPLSILTVFDRLEVGPVKLESKRLLAPYRLYSNGQEHRTELIYRYEEPLFEPSEPESQNLADMIAAQVALNYGLFCRSIVLHGRFDHIDRRFLRDMAENTAREIYVKKFLEPNPFLVDKVASLPPVKVAKYLQAKIVFAGSHSDKSGLQWKLWSSDKNRHCVLSSGGKDSLLSYGLLNEIGREVHPIFVNESGRHWFTALNAYRHFKHNDANTARVWTNSDRLFAWMLRRMPFIRTDFADIRSDQYPIRLWTVAVFLFGALPLLRKRGIGRLVIGDEYDTTVRKTAHGISHYDGLYDQSIFFDHALSRYFMRKGWAVSQFSLLRPLSELMIQKILAHRYPQLLQHQISCHAAHQEGERIYPCGKCEKCRRIVNMLMALDHDPQLCGYRETQIGACLKDFTSRGLSQETPALRHLGFVLGKKGLIEILPDKQRFYREQPEILKARFDAGNSPLNAIPVDLRQPILGIFQEYSRGAIRRTGRRWTEFDPLKHPALHQPYPFELDTANGDQTDADPSQRFSPSGYLWGELTWPEATSRLEEIDVALLPVGAIEQHGPHLPLDTDAFDADYLARRVADACSDPKPLVLPPVSYGVSYHHESFQGTISISNDTLARLIYEIGISVARNGIKKLVVLNGHGGNSPALNHAAQMINRDAHIFVCVDTGETSDVDIYNLIETPNDVHAGEIETSTSLAVRPHLVKMDQAPESIPKFSSRYLDFTSKRGVLWYAHTQRISNTGVMGNPTIASAEKGQKIWELMIAHLVALVEDLKHMSLAEIHHRKY